MSEQALQPFILLRAKKWVSARVWVGVASVQLPRRSHWIFGRCVPSASCASHAISTDSPTLRWYSRSGSMVNVGGLRTSTSMAPDEPCVPCALYGVHVYRPWWFWFTRVNNNDPLFIITMSFVWYGSSSRLSFVHVTYCNGGFDFM